MVIYDAFTAEAVLTPSLAGWTTNTSKSKFSVHASARPQGERDA